MPRYRCCNCEHVVGDIRPSKCPVCYTFKFEDVEPLDDPRHVKNRLQRGYLSMYSGLLFIAIGIATGLGLALGKPPIPLAIEQAIGSFCMLTIVGATYIGIGYWQLTAARKSVKQVPEKDQNEHRPDELD